MLLEPHHIDCNQQGLFHLQEDIFYRDQTAKLCKKKTWCKSQELVHQNMVLHVQVKNVVRMFPSFF